MSAPENGYRVSYVKTFVSWGITLLLGSLFPVVLMAFFGPESLSDGAPLVVTCFFTFAFLVLCGGALMLLPLGLLLLLVRSLNRRALSFERYMILHNLLHLAIALVSFTILDFLFGGIAGAFEIVFLGVVYTIVGLLVWNATFLASFARRKNTW
jgi:hypothetical protein